MNSNSQTSSARYSNTNPFSLAFAVPFFFSGIYASLYDVTLIFVSFAIESSALISN